MEERVVSTIKQETLQILDRAAPLLGRLASGKAKSLELAEVHAALYAIRNSAEMAGWQPLADCVGQGEALMRLARAGELALTPERVNLLQQLWIELAKVLADLPKLQRLSEPACQQLRQNLAEQLPGSAGAAEDRPNSALHSYRIRFRPPTDTFLQGLDPLAFLKNLSELGTCKMVARVDSVPTLDKLNPKLCYFYWDLVLSTAQGEKAIREVFAPYKGACDLTVELADDFD